MDPSVAREIAAIGDVLGPDQLASRAVYAQDVGRAVAWLRANVAGHGGDPDRIVLMGTSAGATHVAG